MLALQQKHPYNTVLIDRHGTNLLNYRCGYHTTTYLILGELPYVNENCERGLIGRFVRLTRTNLPDGCH